MRLSIAAYPVCEHGWNIIGLAVNPKQGHWLTKTKDTVYIEQDRLIGMSEDEASVNKLPDVSA